MSACDGLNDIHIDHHLTCWNLSNNIHMATACHILHDNTPRHSLDIAYGRHLPLLSSTTHTHLGPCTHTNHGSNNKHLLGQQRMEMMTWHPFGCATSSRWQWQHT